MRKVWRVLTWSPAHSQPWWFTAFRLLYTVPMVIILLGWADDTVHFDKVTTDDERDVGKEPNWNTPLDFGSGRCMVIETRQMIDC